ncbi:hypothetical protein B0H14DRAFT_3686211 [Mycena olivaceomarginata]|nr:hypothetical protein B0H14DRAFT_3686211 [Mycena olivaceomarginata]
MPAKAKRRAPCKPTAPKDPEECRTCGQEFTTGLARYETICNTYVKGRKKLVEIAQQRKKKREYARSRSSAPSTTCCVPSPDDVQVSASQPDDFMDVDTGHINIDIEGYAPDAPATAPLPPRFIYCVRWRMPNAQINEDLREMHGKVYSSDCHFHSETLTIDIDGRDFCGPFEVDIEFRDPWRIMKDCVCDPTLAPISTWFSQEKFLCTRGIIEYSNPLYDEPWTGTMSLEQSAEWRKVPIMFSWPAYLAGQGPSINKSPKMHPILFRACWIHLTTHNASGNGGSTLASFVRMPDALRHVDPKTLKSSGRVEYD